MKAIIPCAGFGTRMNMKMDESKELLINPVTKRPLIDFSLKLCRKYGISPLVVTRPEKTDLIEYLKGKADVQIILPWGEWADTVLTTQHAWEEKNILLFPDTYFSPQNTVDKVRELLDEHSLAFGLHRVKDRSKWCSFINGQYIVEKPLTYPNRGTAIGMIGWQRDAGKSLFETLAKKAVYSFNGRSWGEHRMHDFYDLTRTGKIE